MVAEQLRSRKYFVQFLKCLSGRGLSNSTDDDLDNAVATNAEPNGVADKITAKSEALTQIEKNLIDKSVCVLNFVSFIVIFLFMFVSYLIIWSVIIST